MSPAAVTWRWPSCSVPGCGAGTQPAVPPPKPLGSEPSHTWLQTASLLGVETCPDAVLWSSTLLLLATKRLWRPRLAVPASCNRQKLITIHLRPVLGHPDREKSILSPNLPKFTLFVDIYPQQLKFKLKDE